MKNESKTLYIPLYGKAYVSQKHIILHDPYAEQIWQKEKFPLKGKAKSKWLAYYMAMRSAKIDQFVQQKWNHNSCILHLGCGLDARYQRLNINQLWYDIDFKDVIDIRKQYFQASSNYQMLIADVSKLDFLNHIPYHQHGIIIMEGLSMYLSKDVLIALFEALSKHFNTVDIILDAYSTFAQKVGQKRNPIQSVNAQASFGMDDGSILETDRIHLVSQDDLCSKQYIQQLTTWEQIIFKWIYTNKWTSKLYQLYIYRTC